MKHEYNGALDMFLLEGPNLPSYLLNDASGLSHKGDISEQHFDIVDELLTRIATLEGEISELKANRGKQIATVLSPAASETPRYFSTQCRGFKLTSDEISMLNKVF